MSDIIETNETNVRFILPNIGIDIENLTKDLMIQALERTSGNQTEAGKLLGMNRYQVKYRLDKYGIDRRQFFPIQEEKIKKSASLFEKA